MSNIQLDNGRINTFNYQYADGNSLNTDNLQVSNIQLRYSTDKITINFTHGSYNTVDIAQAGISNEDFIAILRSKLKVMVDVNDPLYVRALARMVVAGPEGS